MQKNWAFMCDKWGYTNIYSDEKATKFVTILLKMFLFISIYLIIVLKYVQIRRNGVHHYNL